MLPTNGTVQPTKPPPTVVPERMEPPKKPVNDAPKDFATPIPVEPKKPEPDKIAPVGGDKIAPPGVPPTPPKSDFDFTIPKDNSTPLAKPREADGDLPPLGDKLPPKPEPKKDDKPKDDKPKGEKSGFDVEFPKLAQPTEANKTIVRSSPLADERGTVADVYPRTGSGPKQVVFVNKSGRDVLLTVDGKTTTLPTKNVLKIEAGAKIVWQVGGEAERTDSVPAESNGLDVVIRK